MIETPLPIPPRESSRAARIVKAVFNQFGARKVPLHIDNPRRRVFLCIGLGFIVAANLLIIFSVIPVVNSHIHQSYNVNMYADGYDQLASNLIKGNGYRMYPETARTLTREPGYPFLLAAIFLVFGYSFTAVKVANMLLAFAAAALMTRIATRFSRDTRLLVGAPLIFLFHPGTLMAESRGGVEMLFTLCLTLFLLTMYIALEKKRWRDYVVSGGVLGLTVLVRSTPLLFPSLLFIYLLASERSTSRIVIGRSIALMVIAMFAVLSPWIIRNYLLTGQFIPTASVLGISAHSGLYDDTHNSTGSWAIVDNDGAQERKRLAKKLRYPFKDITNAYYQDFYSTTDEVKFSAYLLHGVMDEYKRHPMLFLKGMTSNFFNLWFRGKTETSTVINLILQLPYLVLAVIGIVLCARNHQIKVMVPPVLLLMYLVAVYMCILAQARYSVPLTPITAIFACIAVLATIGRPTRRSTGNTVELVIGDGIGPLLGHVGGTRTETEIRPARPDAGFRFGCQTELQLGRQSKSICRGRTFASTSEDGMVCLCGSQPILGYWLLDRLCCAKLP